MAAPPMSLNHVLELLVAAQREILDSQRELLSDAALSRQSHGDEGEPSTTKSIEECLLVQRYQENSLGLLNAAAEGLVQVVMHWRPTLEEALGGAPKHQRVVTAAAASTRPSTVVASLRDPTQPAPASSNMLVATLDEVESLEERLDAETLSRRAYQYLFRWLVTQLRALRNARTDEQRMHNNQMLTIEELSAEVQARSVRMISRHHHLRECGLTSIVTGAVVLQRTKYFQLWVRFVAMRRATRTAQCETSKRDEQTQKAWKLFESFSLWHRAKLCRRIESLERENAELKETAKKQEKIATTAFAHDRLAMDEENKQLRQALQASCAQMKSLEVDLERAQESISELTAQLGDALAVNARWQAKCDSNQEAMERAYRVQIEQLEGQVESLRREEERNTQQRRYFFDGVLLPGFQSALDTTVYFLDLHHTMKISCVFDQAAPSHPPPADDSREEVSVGTESTSSDDSVDRSELIFKLSQLTQEVELLRSQRSSVALTVQPATTSIYAAATSTTGHGHVESRASSSLPSPSSYHHESPHVLAHRRTVSSIRSPTSACLPMALSSTNPIGVGAGDIAEQRFHAARMMLARVLRAKSKIFTAATCFRKWSAFSSTSSYNRRLADARREKLTIMQHSVEERDRALIALDEQVETEHVRRMSESRQSISRHDASPSPMRTMNSSSMDHSVLAAALPQESGESPLLPLHLRKWSTGLRSPTSRPPQPTVQNLLHAPLHGISASSDASLTPARPAPLVAPLTADSFSARPLSVDPLLPQPENSGINQVMVENHELHEALTACHHRERDLIAQVEEALLIADKERERVAELEGHHQRLLSDAQRRFAVSELLYDEMLSRADIAHNELRSRFHYHDWMLRLSYKWAVSRKELAHLDVSRANDIMHVTRVRSCAALARRNSLSTAKGFFYSWMSLLYVRRCQRLIAEAEVETAEATRSATEIRLTAQHEDTLVKLQRSHRDTVSALTAQLQEAKKEFLTRDQERKKELQSANEHAEALDVTNRQQNDVIKELHGEVRVVSLQLARLGQNVVEFCASSVFWKWRWWALQRSLARTTMVREYSTAAFVRWMVLSSESTQRLTHVKWTEYSNAVRGVLGRELREAESKWRMHEDKLQDLQQRKSDDMRLIATMQLEISSVWKKRVDTLEHSLHQLQLRQDSDLLLFGQEWEEKLSLFQRASQERLETLQEEHLKFCEELRESEDLRARELLEVERSKGAAQLQAVAADVAAQWQAWISTVVKLVVLQMEQRSGTWFDEYQRLCTTLVSPIEIGCAWDSVVGRNGVDVSRAYVSTWSTLVDTFSSFRDEEHEAVRLLVQAHLRQMFDYRRFTKGLQRSVIEHEFHATVSALIGERNEWLFAVHREAARAAEQQHAKVLSQSESKRAELTAYASFLEEAVVRLEQRVAVLEAEVARIEARASAFELSAKEAETDSQNLRKALSELQLTASAVEAAKSQMARDHANALSESRQRQCDLEESYERVRLERQQEQHRHQKAMDASMRQHEREMVTLRASHEAALVELREKLDREHVANADAAAAEWRREQDCAIQQRVADNDLMWTKRMTAEITAVREAALSVSQQSVAALERQLRASLEAFEASVRQEVLHSRTELLTRVREEVAADIEHRLERMADSQVMALQSQNRVLESRLVDKQREYDSALLQQKVSFDLLVTEIKATHAQRLLEQQSAADALRQTALVEEADSWRRLLVAKQQEAVWGRLSVVVDTEVAGRECVRDLERSARETLVHARGIAGQSLSTCARLQREKAELETSIVELQQRINALAEASNAQLQQTKALHERALDELTTSLLQESKAAIHIQTQRHAAELQRRGGCAASFLRRLQYALVAHRYFSTWKMFSLLRAFRQDYRRVSADRDHEREENARLRTVVAKALEEQRTWSASRPRSLSQEAYEQKVVRSPLSNIDALSPLSEEPAPAPAAAYPHTDEAGLTGRSPATTHRSGQSASPTRIASAMLDFNSHLNDTSIRQESAFHSVDHLVMEVDDLIRRGQRLRLASAPKVQTF